MAKKYVGGIETPTAIEVKGKMPSNTNSYWTEITDLTDNVNGIPDSIMFEGMEIVIDGYEGVFKWNGQDRTVLSNWVNEIKELITKTTALENNQAVAIIGTVTPNTSGDNTGIPQLNGINITLNGYYKINQVGWYGTQEVVANDLIGKVLTLEVRDIETTAVYSVLETDLGVDVALGLKADKTEVYSQYEYNSLMDVVNPAEGSFVDYNSTTQILTIPQNTVLPKANGDTAYITSSEKTINLTSYGSPVKVVFNVLSNNFSALTFDSELSNNEKVFCFVRKSTPDISINCSFTIDGVSNKKALTLKADKTDVEVITDTIQIVEKQDGYYFPDSLGSLIAKITNAGVQSVEFVNKEGELLSVLLATIRQSVTDEVTARILQETTRNETINISIREDGYYFTDANGNVVAKITNSGLQSVEFLNKDGNPIDIGVDYLTSLKGNEFFTLCDSLGTGGVWQSKLAELTGSTFDNNFNVNNNISVGGTRTVGVSDTVGQWRARTLVGLENPPHTIFIENINDVTKISQKGTIDDNPFMLENIITGDVVHNTRADIATYIANDFQAVLTAMPVNERIIGSGFRFPYLSSATKNLEITGVATANGDITLTVGGIGYNIAILTTDSISDILTKILETAYTDYTDTLNVNNVSVDFSTDGLASLTFNANSTGVNAIVTDGSSVTSYDGYIFDSKDVNDWTTVSNWKYDFHNLKLYAGYKGLIEYLQKELPTTNLIWIAPTRFKIQTDVNGTDYDPNLWYADGTFNFSAYQLTADYLDYQELIEVAENTCNMYGVPFINLMKLSGISTANLLDFHDNLNVHPKTAGYEQWGKTLAKNI